MNEEVEVNQKKVKSLTKKILDHEKNNLKTKKDSRDEMADKIKKMIEEEVKKCY